MQSLSTEFSDDSPHEYEYVRDDEERIFDLVLTFDVGREYVSSGGHTIEDIKAGSQIPVLKSNPGSSDISNALR